MGPNEQNQHFAELTQNVHVVVLIRCLPSLDDKLSQTIDEDEDPISPCIKLHAVYNKTCPGNSRVSVCLLVALKLHIQCFCLPLITCLEKKTWCKALSRPAFHFTDFSLWTSSSQRDKSVN